MLGSMQYRDFVWPNNPSRFEVEYRRTLHSYKLPFSGYVVQDLGLQNKIIRGSGEFVGPDAYENFRRLAALFEENKGGKLIHPVWPTMLAYFAKLNLVQEPKENHISYSFEFWEYIDSKFSDDSSEMDKTDYGTGYSLGTGIKFTSAAAGDTLNTISVKTGVSVDKLLKYNPTITDPGAVLKTGRLVRVR